MVKSWDVCKKTKRQCQIQRMRNMFQRIIDIFSSMSLRKGLAWLYMEFLVASHKTNEQEQCSRQQAISQRYMEDIFIQVNATSTMQFSVQTSSPSSVCLRYWQSQNQGEAREVPKIQNLRATHTHVPTTHQHNPERRYRL